MHDLHLLVFGCAVSFIALAGAYVYIRERFETREQSIRSRGEADVRRQPPREVA